MKFRKAVGLDINGIMNIIRKAQDYFKEQGIDQWQNNYPNVEIISKDISNEYGYVLLKDNIIIGTVAVSFDGEKTYEYIYNGRWISNNEYAVIHRMAIDSRYKRAGLATLIIEYIEEVCLDKDVHSIRVDTHKENLAMQKLLKKNGFIYCGIIYLEDKSERMAFEKII
ncbi:MAG TPA: GNAT family N-acetyltransferase [Tissierellales bacterium]|nr:GNAT family N-acetyltransferase [Tissierellales bacterium]